MINPVMEMKAKECYEAGLKHYALGAINKNVMMALEQFSKAATLGYADANYFLGRIHTLGDQVAIDYSVANAYYEEGIRQHSFKSLYAYGLMFYHGLGVAKDEMEAKTLLERAFRPLLEEAKKKDPVSMYMIGTYYYYGFGVTPSLFQAMDWLNHAASLDYADAQYMLGMIHESQAENDQQRRIAKALYEKAALQHHSYALYGLAMMALEEENQKQAILYLEQAARQNYALAAFSLGMIYHEKEPKHPEKAFEWFVEAAKGDHKEALYYVGLYYHQGKGVTKDLDQAILWYKKAALKSEKNALYHLAMILKGQQTEDSSSVYTLLHEAAKQDHPHAQYNLGVMHHKGDGIPQDNEKAFYWYEKASKTLASAQYNLGMMYFEGKVVPKDEIKARDLWEKAASSGFQPAVKLMYSIKNYEKLQKS